MSTDPKPDPFAELRNLLAENARLRARVGVLEHREKIGHAPDDHNALNDACALLGCPVGVNRVDWLTTFAKTLRHELNYDEGEDVDLIEAVREHVAGSQPDLVDERIEIAHILGIRDNEDEADILAPLRRLAALCAQQRDELEARARIARAVCGLAPPTTPAPEPEPIPATWPMPFPPAPTTPSASWMDRPCGDQSHAVYPESEWDDNEPAAPEPGEILDHPCRCCEECDGEDHHWCDANVGIAEDEPDHPAARYGHAAWYVCKHCPAWRAELDDEDEE